MLQVKYRSRSDRRYFYCRQKGSIKGLHSTDMCNKRCFYGRQDYELEEAPLFYGCAAACLYDDIVTQFAGESVANVLHIFVFFHEFKHLFGLVYGQRDALLQLFKTLLHIIHAEIQ